MRRILIKIVLFFIFLMMLCLVVGCTFNKPEVISTNRFLQTDYDYDCLSSDKTFSEIIICQQKQDTAEKTQNHITNELINK